MGKSNGTKNLTTEGTVNWKIWQKVTETSNQHNTGQLVDSGEES